MYCQKCGTQLDDDAQFCKSCGKATDAAAKQEEQSPESTSASIGEQTQKKNRFTVLGIAALPFLAISLWSIIGAATGSEFDFFCNLRTGGTIALVVILSVFLVTFGVFCAYKKSLRTWWSLLAGFFVCLIAAISMIGPVKNYENRSSWSGSPLYQSGTYSQLNWYNRVKGFRAKDSLAFAISATSASAGIYVTIYNLYMAKSKKESNL